MIVASKSPLLQAVVSSGSQFSGAQSKSFLHKSTVAASFMKSMAGLTSTLRQTNCSFIRCVKPNQELTADALDLGMVDAQVWLRVSVGLGLVRVRVRARVRVRVWSMHRYGYVCRLG